MSTNVLQAAKNLPLPERLELLDALWESIVEEGFEPPLTTAQADEIDRRLKLINEILMMSWIGRQLKPSLTPSLEETDVFISRFSSDRKA